MSTVRVIEETTYGGMDDGMVEYVVVRNSDETELYRSKSEKLAKWFAARMNAAAARINGVQVK